VPLNPHHAPLVAKFKKRKLGKENQYGAGMSAMNDAVSFRVAFQKKGGHCPQIKK